jgi:hypothetical protein
MNDRPFADLVSLAKHESATACKNHPSSKSATVEPQQSDEIPLSVIDDK